MHAIAKSRTIRALAAAATLGSVSLVGIAMSPPADAIPADCGVHVVYGPWKSYTGSLQKYRDWNWYDYNCGSSTIHRKVVVTHWADSSCFSIGPGNEAHFHMRELNWPHVRAYAGTVSC